MTSTRRPTQPNNDGQQRFRSANDLLDQQLARAQAEHGDGFDAIPLSLTLLLHRISAMLSRAVSIDLEPLDLSSTQFNVLAVLHRADKPMTMRDVAATLSVRPPNLTSVVDSLVARKLVAKQVSPNDRRSYLVATTRQGDRLMGLFLPSHWRMMNEFYRGLTAGERSVLAQLLDKLLASIQPEDDASQQLAERIIKAALENK